MFELDRRTLLKTGVGLGISLDIANDASAKDPIYLGDMHRHQWFSRLQSGEARPMGQVIADEKVTLVAWAPGANAPPSRPPQIESEDHDRFSNSAVCHELLHPLPWPGQPLRWTLGDPLAYNR